ncbi:RES domain-containing protein [Paraburkholderia sp. BR14374]|uniref:RES domain-containing protein n=1 Tax=Paraburkholderia sp. BR14374 TaxID=3237007 RepID=UPI0034CFC4A9
METAMPAGEEAVLHRVHVGCLPAGGSYWHVFPVEYPATSPNPRSEARLAWRDGSHSMFYAGETPAASLWETVLRDAAVRDGSVYTDPSHLEGMALARLTLITDVPVIDLRTPYRREIVDANTSLDSKWDHWLKQPEHDATHHVTEQLMSQLAAAGHETGAALRWHSRQGGSDSVVLFFAPPMNPAWWIYEQAEVVRLDSDDGHAKISEALVRQGLCWCGIPAGPGFDPPATV